MRALLRIAAVIAACCLGSSATWGSCWPTGARAARSVAALRGPALEPDVRGLQKRLTFGLPLC